MSVRKQKLQPRVGDIWEVRRPGKRRIVKEIGKIYVCDWAPDFASSKQKLWVEWSRLPRGRYSGISYPALLFYGKRLSTKAQRRAEQKARWKKIDAKLKTRDEQVHFFPARRLTMLGA